MAIVMGAVGVLGRVFGSPSLGYLKSDPWGGGRDMKQELSRLGALERVMIWLRRSQVQCPEV